MREYEPCEWTSAGRNSRAWSSVASVPTVGFRLNAPAQLRRHRDAGHLLGEAQSEQELALRPQPSRAPQRGPPVDRRPFQPDERGEVGDPPDRAPAVLCAVGAQHDGVIGGRGLHQPDPPDAHAAGSRPEMVQLDRRAQALGGQRPLQVHIDRAIRAHPGALHVVPGSPLVSARAKAFGGRLELRFANEEIEVRALARAEASIEPLAQHRSLERQDANAVPLEIRDELLQFAKEPKVAPPVGKVTAAQLPERIGGHVLARAGAQRPIDERQHPLAQGRLLKIAPVDAVGARQQQSM